MKQEFGHEPPNPENVASKKFVIQNNSLEQMGFGQQMVKEEGW